MFLLRRQRLNTVLETLLIHIHILYHTIIVFSHSVRTYDFILEIKYLFGDKT